MEQPAGLPSVLAVDVGGTKALVATVRPDGTIIRAARHAMRTDDAVLSPDRLIAHVGAFLDACAVEGREPPVAGGVSIAAAPDEARMRVRYAPNLPGWEGAGLGAGIWQVAGGIPVTLVYDGHAALLGEVDYGAIRACANAVLLVLGTGVGGALFADGRLVEGADGLAGNVGYIPVLSEGRTIGLEAAVSGPALARRGSAALGRDVDSAGLFAAAAAGSRDAGRVLSSCVEELGLALVALTSVMNPGLVVLAGSVGTAFAPFAPDLERIVRAGAQRTAGVRVRIVGAVHGETAALLGAASVARRLANRHGPGSPHDGSGSG